MSGSSKEECISLVEPAGYQTSTCGYCSMPEKHSTSKKSSKSYGTIWPQLSVRVYQDLIDHGWRRSGDYVYHPDMGATCCPQYTIRLDADAFKPSKKQKKALAKWNRYIIGEPSEIVSPKGKPWVKQNGRKPANAPYDFVSEVHSSEARVTPSAERKFEVTLTPAVATAETFALYKRYQMAIHGDAEIKVQPRSFSRFLCESPLHMQDFPLSGNEVPSHLPKQYGSYHQLYRVDGKLVAIGVIDILPSCVSSVYLIWDPNWAWASLGKISALHEIALARDLAAAGAPGMKWLYMGYYIHSCQKMRYKGEYEPSYLLDPGTNVFHPLKGVTSLLKKHPRGYRPFAEATPSSPAPMIVDSDEESTALCDDEDDEEGAAWPEIDPPGFSSPSGVSASTLDKLAVLSSEGIARSFKALPPRYRLALQPNLKELIAALGHEKLATTDASSGSNTYLFFG